MLAVCLFGYIVHISFANEAIEVVGSVLKATTFPGFIKKQEASYEVHSLHRGLWTLVSKIVLRVVRLTLT